MRYLALFLLVAITSCSFGQTKTVWTKTYQRNIYKTYYSMADTMKSLTTQVQKQAFAKCALEKSMLLMPKGIDYGPKDKLYKIGKMVGMNCIFEVQYTYPDTTNHGWTEASKKAIKETFMQRADLQVMKQKARSYFCDCYIERLEKIYPKGITSKVPEEVVNKIAEECIDKMSEHEKDLQ